MWVTPACIFCAFCVYLVFYTGEKVGEGHICLWCNEKTKTFLSVKSVQQHMQDKGHCKMIFEGDAIFEYSDYYDYRSVVK